VPDAPARPTGEVVVFLDVDGALSPRTADLSPWGEPVHATGTDEVFGWWKLDAACTFLDAHPGVRTVIWADDELAQVDDLDVEHHEVVQEVLAERGLAHLVLAGAGLPPTGDQIALVASQTTAPFAWSLPTVEDAVEDEPSAPAAVEPDLPAAAVAAVGTSSTWTCCPSRSRRRTPPA
jgi:hypothetical protein